MFRYLVTPSGGKQANSAVDLFMSLNDEGGKAPSAQALRDILERLAAPDRRILRTQPNVNAPNDGPLFELFHDALAQPVLEWTQRERAAELELQRDKARRQVRLAGAAIVVLAALLVITVIAGLIARGSIKEAAVRNRELQLGAIPCCWPAWDRRYLIRALPSGATSSNCNPSKGSKRNYSRAMPRKKKQR